MNDINQYSDDEDDDIDMSKDLEMFKQTLKNEIKQDPLLESDGPSDSSPSDNSPSDNSPSDNITWKIANIIYTVYLDGTIDIKQHVKDNWNCVVHSCRSGRFMCYVLDDPVAPYKMNVFNSGNLNLFTDYYDNDNFDYVRERIQRHFKQRIKQIRLSNITCCYYFNKDIDIDEIHENNNQDELVNLFSNHTQSESKAKFLDKQSFPALLGYAFKDSNIHFGTFDNGKIVVKGLKSKHDIYKVLNYLKQEYN